MGSYDQGDLVRIRGAFTSRALTDPEKRTFQSGGGLPASTGVDPASVTLRVRKPDKTTVLTFTGGQLTHEGTGVYHCDVPVDVKGNWEYRWESTGSGQAAAKGALLVSSEWG